MEYYFVKLFSKNLNRLMETYNKKQTDIVNATGASKGSVSAWCSGDTMPRADKIQLIANYFNVGLDELLTDCEKKQNKDELTEIDKQILAIIHALPEDRQRRLLDTIRQIVQL